LAPDSFFFGDFIPLEIAVARPDYESSAVPSLSRTRSTSSFLATSKTSSLASSMIFKSRELASSAS
jgi:hypothetical protein